MIWKKEKFTIENIECIAYLTGIPKYILLQPVDEHDIKVIDKEIEILSNELQDSFLMIAFQINDWNNELSPWKASAVFGNEDFGDGAKETLAFIENILMKNIYKKYRINEDVPVILGGYSLAGLFSLWSAYQSKHFDGIVAASPSVWFKGWLKFINEQKPVVNTIYLSLGNKEEKTKNKIMGTVGQVIRIQEEILKNKKIKTILEWNEGGHFKDSHIRLAKGFLWCIKSLIK